MISPEVKAALQQQQPVVALESTIISHGMPYPKNYQTALEVEAVVRANGAVPATVAVLSGIPHVGLTHTQIHDLAKKGLKFQKTSRRDFAYVMCKKLDGSTTVSATMVLAARAGIAVFVTGGMHYSGHANPYCCRAWAASPTPRAAAFRKTARLCSMGCVTHDSQRRVTQFSSLKQSHRRG